MIALSLLQGAKILDSNGFPIEYSVLSKSKDNPKANLLYFSHHLTSFF